jgi:hypothetical protein
MSARKLRAGCFEIGAGGAYMLTDVGLAKIQELAQLGSSIKEIAEYLRVSVDWLRERLDEDDGDDRVRQAYLDGQSEFRKELRIAQRNLALESAQMAIWMGKQHLDQSDRQQIDINKKITVVGTLPNYRQTPQDWEQTFVPQGVRAALPPAHPAEDAEIVEVRESTDDGESGEEAGEDGAA